MWATAVGYIAGATPNPTYEEVCSGRTGHTEAVLVVYDPKQVTYTELLKTFWESHDPTQACARATTLVRNTAPVFMSSTMHSRSRGAIEERVRSGTEAERLLARSPPRFLPRREFYFAEDYHQQYLAKNPRGYCGLGGTGVACQIGTGVAA